MATLTAWHIPKSSALTNNKRESAGYPKRLFVRGVFPVFIVISPLPSRKGFHSDTGTEDFRLNARYYFYTRRADLR
jgi:hypothetical protein